MAAANPSWHQDTHPPPKQHPGLSEIHVMSTCLLPIVGHAPNCNLAAAPFPRLEPMAGQWVHTLALAPSTGEAGAGVPYEQLNRCEAATDGRLRPQKNGRTDGLRNGPGPRPVARPLAAKLNLPVPGPPHEQQNPSATGEFPPGSAAKQGPARAAGGGQGEGSKVLPWRGERGGHPHALRSCRASCVNPSRSLAPTLPGHIRARQGEGRAAPRH